jgi:hypothetical protein
MQTPPPPKTLKIAVQGGVPRGTAVASHEGTKIENIANRGSADRFVDAKDCSDFEDR